MSQEPEQTEKPEQLPGGNSPAQLARDTARGFAKEFVGAILTTLKWAAVGALIGALLAGGAGWVLIGHQILGLSCLVGAVVGAFAGGSLILLWKSPFD